MALKGTTDSLFNGLIIVILAAALVPSFFDVNLTAAPAFLQVVWPILVGVGLLMVIKRSMAGGKD